MPNPNPDTSFEHWQALGRPGMSYQAWVQQETGNPDATGTVRYNGASVEPGISDSEFIKRKRNELGTLDQLPPDIADMALRDVVNGGVMRARRGSSRGALGMAFDAMSPLGTGAPLLGGA